MQHVSTCTPGGATARHSHGHTPSFQEIKPDTSRLPPRRRSVGPLVQRRCASEFCIHRGAMSDLTGHHGARPLAATIFHAEWGSQPRSCGAWCWVPTQAAAGALPALLAGFQPAAAGSHLAGLYSFRLRSQYIVYIAQISTWNLS